MDIKSESNPVFSLLIFLSLLYGVCGVFWLILVESTPGIFEGLAPGPTGEALGYGALFLVGFVLIVCHVLRNYFSTLESQDMLPSEIILEHLTAFAYRYTVDPETGEWEPEYFSAGAKRYFDESLPELLDLPGFSHLEKNQTEGAAPVVETVQEALKEEELYDVEYRFETSEGEPCWLHDRGKGVYDDTGRLQAVEGVAEDITKRKNARQNCELAQAEAEYLAQYDSLTGLSSRGYFLEEATGELRQVEADGETSYIFCIVDVMDFRKFNNFYGYWIGNRILEHTARLLQKRLPDESLLGRLGNDEFGVLLPAADSCEPDELIRQKLCPLENSFQADGEEISYHLRVGAATYPADGEGLEELLAAANRALGRGGGARDLRKDKILMHRESDFEDLELRIKSSEKLLNALDEKRLDLHYQPVVDCRNDEILMLEALLRINSPSGEVRTLQNFSNFVHDPHLTAQIDSWVIEQAVRQSVDLLGNGDVPYVSINLFPASILKPEIFEELDTLVDDCEFPRDKVVIEVTEKLLGSYSNRTFRSLLEVTEEYGFSIALDDFGVGHGSFRTIKDLPLDFIKIDGSFVHELGGNEMNQNFVRSLADLGQKIDVEVIGEWIETEETSEKLSEMGIYYHQGFYYCRPVPLEEAIGGQP